jgi:hypothetical protein
MFPQFAEAGKKCSKAVHMLKKSVINMICLLLPVFDWSIMMSGPGGLLLVIPTYFAESSPCFQSCGWGCKNVNN